ncbi:guanine nucleotide exchange factor C9orf72 homolog [Antedon mediterranea]|uniref:guanine nucleotide exchange factor C9orf72 homolog n=1 Tax=Antedon mediterranea TaxID=105859 RepID=UPI003AF915FB
MSHIPFLSLSSTDEFAKVTTVLEESVEYPVCAVILCLWNNILGPHIEYVWMTEGSKHMDYGCTKFICKNTISSSDQSSTGVHTKFLVLPDRGILVTSSIFCADIGSGNTVYGFSLVFPYSDLQWYLPLHEFCCIQMEALVTKLRVLLRKDHKTTIGKFQVYLCKHLEALKSLKLAQLPEKLDIKDTAYSSGQEKQFDAELMERALISHLQTSGCTIVVGSNVDEVNRMLKTLALFLSPRDRRCSRLAVEKNPYLYHPDIFLQGFINNETCQFIVSNFMKEMMTGRYPTTLVDLCSLEVRQMPPCHEHLKRRHDVLQHEMKCMWIEKSNALFLILSAFQQVHTNETLVHNFQKEIFLLQPTRGVRESYIEQFTRLIDRKAFALIKYLETESKFGRNAVKTKTIKKELDLTLEGNWKIVLARAERMRSGIYSIAYSNTAQFNDQHVIDEFDTF